MTYKRYRSLRRFAYIYTTENSANAFIGFIGKGIKKAQKELNCTMTVEYYHGNKAVVTIACNKDGGRGSRLIRDKIKHLFD